MIIKKLKAKVREDKTLILHVPDIPSGEVEVIILKGKKRAVPIDKLLSQIPKHRMGKILGSLRREDIYTDAR